MVTSFWGCPSQLFHLKPPGSPLWQRGKTEPLTKHAQATWHYYLVPAGEA